MGTTEFCETHKIMNCYDCFYKAKGKNTNDLPRGVIEQKIKVLNADGWTCWAKWTCVRCGTRNVAPDPDVLKEAYTCSKCQHLNKPDEFGIRTGKGAGL